MECDGVSAIVLAGGRSSRFGGDKLAAIVDGRTLLQRAIEAVAHVADEVILVIATGASPRVPAIAPPLVIVRDARPFAGPLAGLHDGAAAATHPNLLVVGGDMPDLQPAVLRLLIQSIAEGAEAAILGDADTHAPIHPLPLALARSGLPHIDALLAADRTSLRALIATLRTIHVPAARWRALDPDGRTRHDVDVPSDLPDPA